MEQESLEDALATLGEILEERGQHIGLLVVGGSSLLLLGFVTRPTADVDVAALVGSDGYTTAVRLPEFLSSAIEDVGDALGLGPTWMNSGLASLLDFGLPHGTENRVTVRRFGSLEVHLPAREDLVCLKLYAATDQGPRSKHFADLRALSPSEDELLTAARWARTHDTSEGFLGELQSALTMLGVEVGDGDI